MHSQRGDPQLRVVEPAVATDDDEVGVAAGLALETDDGRLKARLRPMRGLKVTELRG